MICGDVLALSVRVMDAVSGPETVGAKRAPISHWVPAAMLVPQVFEVTNEAGSAPVSVMLLK
jgi:hypothetical protein